MKSWRVCDFIFIFSNIHNKECLICENSQLLVLDRLLCLWTSWTWLGFFWKMSVPVYACLSTSTNAWNFIKFYNKLYFVVKGYWLNFMSVTRSPFRFFFLPGSVFCEFYLFCGGKKLLKSLFLERMFLFLWKSFLFSVKKCNLVKFFNHFLVNSFAPDNLHQSLKYCIIILYFKVSHFCDGSVLKSPICVKGPF